MQWSEKLAKLTEGRNKQRVSTDAGLPATAVSDYIAKRNIPRADKVLGLARTLDVSLEWLLDDAQEWPPPTVGRLTPAALSDEDLLREVCRRYRVEAVRLHDALRDVDVIDWVSVAAEYLSAPRHKGISFGIFREVRTAETIVAGRFNVNVYNPSEQAARFHGELPGSDVDPAELRAERLLALVREAHERHPALRILDEAIRLTIDRGDEDEPTAAKRLALLADVKSLGGKAIERPKKQARK